MKKAVLLLLLLAVGCKYYSFTGASIPEGAETVQVNFFINDAANEVGSVFEPGLDSELYQCSTRDAPQPNKFRPNYCQR